MARVKDGSRLSLYKGWARRSKGEPAGGARLGTFRALSTFVQGPVLPSASARSIALY